VVHSNAMVIGAIYVCPLRGLASLEVPEPERFFRTISAARDLGLKKVLVPVLEESLVETKRAKIKFLDGLVRTLDMAAEARIDAWLIALPQSLLGLSWAAPAMVRAVRDSAAPPVYVDGKVRHLLPLDWWRDPSLVEKKIGLLREILSAVGGHPAAYGFVILNRALEWERPDSQAADFVTKSFAAEIREIDEKIAIYLGFGLSEILDPELGQLLVGQVDGIHLSGLEADPEGINRPKGIEGELVLAGFLGSMASWLFAKPVQVEVGWSPVENEELKEKALDACRILARQSLHGVTWVSLVDPHQLLLTQPPWALREGLESVGLFDKSGDPKKWVGTLIEALSDIEENEKSCEFLDLSLEEYLKDPPMHLTRLWNRFLEAEGFGS